MYYRIRCSALVVLAVVMWSWVTSRVHCVKVTVRTVTFTKCTRLTTQLHKTTANHSQHNQCRTPHAVGHGLLVLMMGIMMSETYWDRSLIINIELVASCWCSLFTLKAGSLKKKLEDGKVSNFNEIQCTERKQDWKDNWGENNNNIYLLQLGCHLVAVVILRVNKTWNWLLLNLSREGYMRSMCAMHVSINPKVWISYSL